jgi:hypothetical protein
MRHGKLVRWLHQHGCQKVRPGRRHDWWHGPEGGQAAVPRHHEINTLTARAICDQLNIERPPGA